MRVKIITEGKTDEVILSRILSAVLDPSRFEVVSAGGRSAAISSARSFLATSDLRAALVVDADTTDRRRVRSDGLVLKDLLSFAGSESRFLVLQAVPSVEACLFEDPDRAETLFQRRMSGEERTRARFEPRKIMAEILGATEDGTVDPSALEEFLQGRDLKPLAGGSLISELRRFISQEPSKIAHAT